jgi:pectate lyase
MPRINGSNKNDIEALVDYRNNVNFNWGSSGAFYGGEWEATNGLGFSKTNVVNNYFIPGPATSSSVYFAAPSYNRSGVQVDGYAQWYFSGNVMKGHPEMTNDNWLGVNGSGVGGVSNIRVDNVSLKSDGTLEDYDSYTETADEALTSILENVGAILPKRDTIDARVIAEVRGETEIMRFPFTTDDGQVTPNKGVNSGLIDTQYNLVPTEKQDSLTAWDVYKSSANSPIDSDHDGIPNDWETQHGLNPEDITDGRLIAENGYSNLENFLNSLDITVSTSQIDWNEKFNVYPNPVTDVLQIRSDKKITEIGVFDLFGRKLDTINSSFGIEKFSFSNYTTGIYLLTAATETGKIFYKKVIKQ